MTDDDKTTTEHAPDGEQNLGSSGDSNGEVSAERGPYINCMTMWLNAFDRGTATREDFWKYVDRLKNEPPEL